LDIIKYIISKDLPALITIIVILCILVFETIVLARIFLPIWFSRKDTQGEKMKSINNKQPNKACSYSLQTRHEKRLEKIERMLEEDVTERKIRQAEFDEKLRGINTSIKELADRTDDVSRGTLENMVFNDDHPSIFNRLKALRRLIAMDVNGRICDKGYKLILANKETWKDVSSMSMNLDIKNKEYYEKTMRDFNRLVYAN
jgi:hypothetical protein